MQEDNRIIDLMIGEALEQLSQAATIIKRLETGDADRLLFKIGKVLSELWDIREDIYKNYPQLKSEILVECEKDEKKYYQLIAIQTDAYKFEEAGDWDNAFKLYKELLDNSNIGFFQKIAEAGLYRQIQKMNKEAR